MKATLARLGIRGFKPDAASGGASVWNGLRTPEGVADAAEHVGRAASATWRACGFVGSRSRRSRGHARSARGGQPETDAHAMVHLLARVVGVGIETADMLVQEVFSRNLRDRKAVARYAGLTGARRTRAARSDASKGSPKPAMPECAAA